MYNLTQLVYYEHVNEMLHKTQDNATTGHSLTGDEISPVMAQQPVVIGSSKHVTSPDSWNVNILLAIILGPLAVILLVSYIIHWYQVLQRVRKNREERRQELLETPHTKAATMLSIRTLENQRSEILTNTTEVSGVVYVSVPTHEYRSISNEVF